MALATIHEALADVAGLLTKELLRKVIRITADSMARDFAMKSPRIAVAGLNPHAGEAGKFGREEIEVIRPVIEEFEAARLQTGGPGAAFTPVSAVRGLPIPFSIAPCSMSLTRLWRCTTTRGLFR